MTALQQAIENLREYKSHPGNGSIPVDTVIDRLAALLPTERGQIVDGIKYGMGCPPVLTTTNRGKMINNYIDKTYKKRMIWNG